MKFSLERATSLIATAENSSAEMMAILKGEVEMPIKKLINLVVIHEFDINTPLNEQKETALMLAASGDKPELVEAILNLDANINQLNAKDETALVKAALNNHAQILKLLFRQGANCTYTLNTSKKKTFIYTHAKQLSQEVFSLCLKQLHENEQPEWEDIALNVMDDHEKFVVAFEYAKKSNQKGISNRLLQVAIEKDNPKACTLILEDIMKSDRYYSCHSLARIEVPAEKHAYHNKYNKTSAYNHTPFTYAYHRGSLNALKAMLTLDNAGINSRAVTHVYLSGCYCDGMISLLTMVVIDNNLEVLKLLLSYNNLSLGSMDNLANPTTDSTSNFAIAIQHGFHEAAQMMVLHPNFLVDEINVPESSVGQHAPLLKARRLSTQAKEALKESKLGESQQLFQEALNLSPEVVYNDAIFVMSTGDNLYINRLLAALYPCISNSKRFQELYEVIGLEVFHNKVKHEAPYLLAAAFLAKARLSHDANRILLTCYYQIENKTFAPTNDSLDTLLLNQESRDVILRAHSKVKLFANQLACKHKNISDKMLVLMASEIKDPISLMDFCVDNDMTKDPDVRGDAERAYLAYINLTASTSQVITLASSLTAALNDTAKENPPDSNDNTAEMQFK